MTFDCRHLRQALVSGRSETTGVWPLNSSIAKRPVARTEASFRGRASENDGLFWAHSQAAFAASVRIARTCEDGRSRVDPSFDKIGGVQVWRELQNCARKLGTQPLISRHLILAPTLRVASYFTYADQSARR
jgi:hypothetical protein